ncbi:hypothetical protein Naga_100299g4 [Nannochloropsis gaditana]|uniref:Nucleolar protein 16 n=1 Tax=Nannochloropsis gaditana TaxID=72520 RepID=W7UA83_9STRA|nr:hypothetical protein Naga_100299g4 [Nannochloropsis gaditana]
MKVRRGAKKIRLQGKRQNHSKFSKPKTGMHSVVQTVWEGKDSVRKNLQKLGVSDDPNRTTAFCASPTGSSGIDPQDVFSLPPAERRDRNPRRRPMSAEDQAYIVKLLMVHGNDYKRCVCVSKYRVFLFFALVLVRLIVAVGPSDRASLLAESCCCNLIFTALKFVKLHG